MDEGTLNDLLECSVCLERLDTSSKVLPCQHTFCRKCLEEIFQKHKELRCPECRVLVNMKIEELPPNVLLMRILEGMKNSGPKKAQRPNRTNILMGQYQGSNIHQVHINQHNLTDQRMNNKHANSHMVPHQPYAKALYDYISKEAGDLNFKRGDIIILKKRIDNHWYQGECGGKQGVFPLSYVQVITPVPSHIPQCKALYDFRMTNDEEEGCLSFNKGDIINVIRRVDENWAEGKLDGKIGIFPLAFVEMNNLARSLMKLSTNVQPGPSKVAPPTPTVEGSTPLILTDHCAGAVTRPSTQVSHQPSIVVSDSSSNNCSSSSSTTTPNVSSSNTSSSSSTAPSSPASPPPRARPVSPRVNRNEIVKNSSKSSPNPHQIQPGNADGRSHHHNKEKRHSLSNITMPQHNSNMNRHSAEILTSNASQASSASSHGSERTKRNSSGSLSSSVTELQLPTAVIALYPYKPQKPDELELRKGGIYMVSEICQDGWYRGTSNRTQKCGVFPGNYVTLARGVHGSASSSSKDGAASDSKLPVSFTRAGKGCGGGTNPRPAAVPPELPPRSVSPAASATAVSSSWHGQDGSVAASFALGRSSSATMAGGAAAQQFNLTKTDKPRDRKDKGTVSLMRRLTSIKRSKSPPPSSYSMDNPVFEDAAASSAPAHPVHVRSVENPTGSSRSSPDVHRHKKSNSLDGSKAGKTGVQTVRERFRCITPYPPNSEYELELQVNDIIYVHKKREDGWYKGTQQRTGKTGLFPASFVESF